MEKGNIYKRILMMLIGNVILGTGAGMLRAADFGVDPYQCFVLGIDKALKLGYGTTFVIVNAVFLVLMLVLARKMLNVGTLVNMFLIKVDFPSLLLPYTTTSPEGFSPCKA